MYTSTEGHSCIQKAIELLGIGHAHLRRIGVTADWRMDPRSLRQQIADDRAAGLTPACVTATAGTVNTGAIDPLSEIADLCEAENIWYHVDAAYGGPAALLPELAELYSGIERADSLAVDPHKWMYVPVECDVRSCATLAQCVTRSPWFRPIYVTRRLSCGFPNSVSSSAADSGAEVVVCVSADWLERVPPSDCAGHRPGTNASAAPA